MSARPVPSLVRLIGVEMLSSKQVYADAWLSVRMDKVRRSDGSSGDYSVVDSADFSLVVPLDGDRVHLVEQYRRLRTLRRGRGFFLGPTIKRWSLSMTDSAR